MEEITEYTAKEVMTVLLNSEIPLIFKIPYKLWNYLEEKAYNCKTEIVLKQNTSLIDQPISDEAKAILTLIYKDFFANKEEKNQMNEILNEENKPEELFNKTDRVQINVEQENTSLVIVEKWYEKVISFFRKVFKNRK